MELAKAYDPKEAQTRCLDLWTRLRIGHAEPDSHKPYSIVIPPPNVTGALHMGHALNNTLQDVLIRWRRMQGYNTEWMPGTDHAGIATQAVVEKRIWAEEKKTRREIGREELVKRIWQWKDQYESRILGQLREIGCSCDWQRTAFTLDEKRSRAVRETFFRMFRDGYIFRGKRLVNWDTQLQTSVADDETDNIKQKGKFYYLRYPVFGAIRNTPDFVVIATTRPETMLGDMAVAVHPEPRKELEKREQELLGALKKAGEKEGKEIKDRLDRIAKRQEVLPHLELLARMASSGTQLILPLLSRLIPLIADRYADPEKGTGAVKITPAHDFNDYEVWQRHPDLGRPINILKPDGTINEKGEGLFHGRAYSYVGMDRFEARDRIVAELTQLGLLDREEEIENTIPISDRSKTPIEPYLSDQWFVKMGEAPKPEKQAFADIAMEAVTSGRVKFFPERYKNTYLEWLGEKRDWCISRQLWWGHRIPVWEKTIPIDGLPNEIPDADSFVDPTGGFWSEAEKQQLKDKLYCQRLNDPAAGTMTTFFCIAPGNEGIEKSLENSGFTRSEDVLDTWFSSMLWTHSTFGWPDETPELKYYYPTSTLVTSRDIITLWVARMVIAGLYNLGEVPFREVYITPKMLDGFGETMSKSKGNGVDPLDIIELYGADALRFQMVSIAGETQDSRLPVSNVCPHCGELVAVKQEHMYLRTKKLACPKCKKQFRPGGPWPDEDPELPTAKQASERFEIGRNFANKLWNAARFVLKELDGFKHAALDPKTLPIEDRWILSRLATTAKAVTEQLEAYRFNEVSRTIYDFTWSEFCDWYIEMAKGRLKEGEPPASAGGGKAAVQWVLVNVLDSILRLVHPVMPFVAESLWQALNEVAPVRGLPTATKATDTIAFAPWPVLPAEWQDPAMESRIARMQELVRIVRDVRNRYNVDGKTPLDVFVRCSDAVAADFQALQTFIALLGGVGRLASGPSTAKPKQAASQVTPEFEAYVSLIGLIDPAAEVKRLEKQVADKTKQLEATKKKLANADFVAKAPPEVVASQRELIGELEKQIASMQETIRELSAG